MKQHAYLSASGSDRWLNCTPSVAMESKFENTQSQYAEEGTLAHALAELLTRQKLGEGVDSKRLKEIYDHPMYSEAMYEHCDNFATFVMERYNSYDKPAIINLEQELSLEDYVPGGFGTCDVSILAVSVLEIIDFKYGKGVFVDAHENRQMMLYALGALKEFEYFYVPPKVVMTIYQPRIDNYSSFEMKTLDLVMWAESELKPKAELAFSGAGELVAGKHCHFCRATAVCKAHAEYNLELAKQDFQDPRIMTKNDVAKVLSKLPQLLAWADAVKEYALDQAINHHEKFPGFKVVEGRSNRKYLDEEKVAKTLQFHGLSEEEIYQKKLYGITEMEKKLGKSKFTQLLKDLLIKPAGAPTLVPETDKRPELNTTESAVKDFE